MPLKERIRQRLIDLKLSGRAASKAAGLSETFIKDILNDRVISPKYESIAALARVLETTAEWLIEGRAPGSGPKLPLRYYVGAGASVMPFDDQLALEWVDVPPGADDVAEAGRIVGTSQLPVFRPGDIVFWGEGSSDVSGFVGLECVCHCADGRVLLKRVGYGSRPGFYTLSSYNEGDMPDVEVTAAAPVIWVKRAQSR